MDEIMKVLDTTNIREELNRLKSLQEKEVELYKLKIKELKEQNCILIKEIEELKNAIRIILKYQ
jgi:hypothetical protein